MSNTYIVRHIMTNVEHFGRYGHRNTAINKAEELTRRLLTPMSVIKVNQIYYVLKGNVPYAEYNTGD